ncbi:hypothetical protein [Enterocloster bolteae]|jgi:hypothetical protein|uniref:Uncharacterized protein n=2 Tax=Enterocloster bolteae TaxID=208479 RepID=A0A414AQ53_9FIRM|nr:hypothetical protein [Enterocloster bolteae]ENZ34871.1 hypothetical protein HMPREF1097_04261 [Enterocloster bolteae 90B8]RGO74035.1 hypothetical protein DXB04_31135 [Enterocloster bolteae]RHC52771.1 hypothetical protein DW839_22980 [Enterocloster bolteae]
MKIKFKNGSSIESIGDESDVKRSQRVEEQIARMLKRIQYWQYNPDKYIEFITGVKLSWYQKAWVKLWRKNKK